MKSKEAARTTQQSTVRHVNKANAGVSIQGAIPHHTSGTSILKSNMAAKGILAANQDTTMPSNTSILQTSANKRTTSYGQASQRVNQQQTSRTTAMPSTLHHHQAASSTMQSSTIAASTTTVNRNHHAGNSSSNATASKSNYTTVASGGSKALTMNKRPAGGEQQNTSSTSCLNLDQSYRSIRAQSRRNVPSHYFHPVGEAAAADSDASFVADGASPQGKTAVDASTVGGNFNEPMPQTQKTSHTNIVLVANSENTTSHDPRKIQQVISRDSIQPAKAGVVANNHRQGSTVKRRSVLHANQQQNTNRVFGKKTSRNHHEGGDTGEHLKAQRKLQREHMETLNMLGSLETIMTQDLSAANQSKYSTNFNQNSTNLVAQQRKNSSLSRRDQQLMHMHNQQMQQQQQQQFQSTGGGRRRKSSSNPRQKIGSNMRATLQVQPSSNITVDHHHPQYPQQNHRIRVQRSSRGPKISQKYGYKYGGQGPLEAYSTTSNNNFQQQQHYPNPMAGNAGTLQQVAGDPHQQIFTSIEAPAGSNVASNGAGQQLMHKKLSANQIAGHPVPQMIQISQDINPMNLQHLSSIDRAGSIDSACYDFQAHLNGGFLSVTNPVSTGLTPKTGKAGSEAAGTGIALGANANQTSLPQGFSEMLKHTILGTTQQQQSRSKDDELEAAVLSLDQSQITQNLMKEFINAGNGSSVGIGNPTASLPDDRKTSLPAAAASASIGNNPRLESLIQQLIVRKEITQSPNIQQRRPYNTGQITAAHHSLQAAAHHQIPDAILGMRTVHKVSNFASSLHGGNAILKQEQHQQQHSAEDLLRIGGQVVGNFGGPNVLQQESVDQSPAALGGGSPGQRLMKPLSRPAPAMMVLQPAQQQPHPKQLKQLVPKTFRPQQAAANVDQAMANSTYQNNNLSAAASFGQISHNLQNGSANGNNQLVQQPNGARNNSTIVPQPAAEEASETIVLSMSDTFGFPHNQTQPLKGNSSATGNQTLSAISNSVVNHHDQQQFQTVVPVPDSALQTINFAPPSDQKQQSGTTAADQPQHLDYAIMNNRQKFLSLDQPQLPNPKKALASDGSIEDVYHKTLSAYQNDINQLQEINRTRREVSNRIVKAQNLLQSIQGVNATNVAAVAANGGQIAPSSASAVLIDSVANTSSIIGQGGNLTDQNLQLQHQQQQLQQSSNLNALISMQQQQMMLEQPLAMSQAIPGAQQLAALPQHHPVNMTTGSSLNYNNAAMVPNDPSYRGSFVDSSGFVIDGSSVGATGGVDSSMAPRGAGIIIQNHHQYHHGGNNNMSFEQNSSKNKQQSGSNVTTSPIVGRYRLKHHNVTSTNGTSSIQHKQQHQQHQQQSQNQQTANKRQQAYDQSSIRTTITAADSKRTKSVRPRRPNVGGSNLRGGGRRAGAQSNNNNQHNQAVVRNKFDSIAQAYHSTAVGMTLGRGENHDNASATIGNNYNNTTNSQRSFGAGFGSVNNMVDISPSQQLLMVQPQQQQVSAAATNTKQQRSQLQPKHQTIEQHTKSSGLQQTYGVPQKLLNNSITATNSGIHQGQQQSVTLNAKRQTAVGSVPRQRHGAGFSSNLRPPIKQTERSLSHNRNRAQHSFKQMNSFVAQHTYLSVGSGSIGSAVGAQQQQQYQQIHGSAQYGPQATAGGSIVAGVNNENNQETGSFEIQTAISPINTQQNRSFKYRPKQHQQVTAAAINKNRQGKNKSSSRGPRGAVVANSTQLVGPTTRKQSRIIGGASGQQFGGREPKKTQLSHQQVQEVRGSLVQNAMIATGGLATHHNVQPPTSATMSRDGIAQMSNNLSPEQLQRRTAGHQHDLAKTPPSVSDFEQVSGGSPNTQQRPRLQQQSASPPLQHGKKVQLMNKITRVHAPGPQYSDPATQEEEAAQMSVGGQEIVGGGPGAPAANAALVMRTHNLRYSSAVNDFSSYAQQPNNAVTASTVDNQEASSGSQKQLMGALVGGHRPSEITNAAINRSDKKNTAAERSHLNRSELSQETQERQNQAMKLINEDNPFENPAPVAKKEQTAYHIMSFAADESNKSIAEKTTERESKNTNRTGGFGASSSGAAASGAQFTFSKQSGAANPRHMILQHNSNAGAPSSMAGAAAGQQQMNSAMLGRRSLLGITTMRRSETTEDSQQCKYVNGSIMMSSLPMPMHSIKQVIAEEEAAEEQDERTTNKESKGLLKQKTTTTPSGGNQSSSNQNGNGSGGGKRSTPIDEPNMLVTDDDGSSLQNSIKVSEAKDEHQPANIHNNSQKATEVLQIDEEDGDNVVLMAETPQQMKSARVASAPAHTQDQLTAPNATNTANATTTAAAPPRQDFQQQQLQVTDHKQSERYSNRNDDDAATDKDNNVLCESSIAGNSYSVQMIDDSGVNIMDTPDVLASKPVDKKTKQGNDGAKVADDEPIFAVDNRRSYNRGAFQQMSADKLQAEWPPQLSESSYRNSRRRVKQHSDDESAHSDDEIEVRRGLESERQRTDMGSHPELLRQSTHSLLHKNPVPKIGEKEAGASCTADMLVLKKPTKHCDESNENLISDEININLSRELAQSHKMQSPQKQIAARNNNYFDVATPAAADSEKRKEAVALSQGGKAAELVDGDEEEEDCGIVGGVDDAEEFKLGKVI